MSLGEQQLEVKPEINPERFLLAYSLIVVILCLAAFFL